MHQHTYLLYSFLSKHVVLVGTLSKVLCQDCSYSKLHSNSRPCGKVTVCEDTDAKMTCGTELHLGGLRDVQKKLDE